MGRDFPVLPTEGLGETGENGSEGRKLSGHGVRQRAIKHSKGAKGLDE
jgi:hypothetical protein